MPAFACSQLDLWSVADANNHLFKLPTLVDMLHELLAPYAELRLTPGAWCAALRCHMLQYAGVKALCCLCGVRDVRCCVLAVAGAIRGAAPRAGWVV